MWLGPTPYQSGLMYHSELVVKRKMCKTNEYLNMKEQFHKLESIDKKKVMRTLHHDGAINPLYPHPIGAC